MNFLDDRLICRGLPKSFIEAACNVLYFCELVTFFPIYILPLRSKKYYYGSLGISVARRRFTPLILEKPLLLSQAG